ncbi:hypothetical protein RJ640_004532 [Escallonia rubra]|uniref:Uncharacterized protein n=1 Tax=Escallonia rubra TaxID=112253 RepID=A0AA88UHI6_9ASTE|nr:hypothetical protein RJ640_004532 [Escallonia rubra]
MGVWDDLRSIAGRVINRHVPDINVRRVPYITGLPSAIKDVGNGVRSSGAQKLEILISDPDNREKIARVVSSLGGIQVYKIVKEGFKDQPLTHSASKNQKSDMTLLVEEMQSQVEKLREELNDIKQQNEISTHSTKASDPVKEELSAEPAKISSPRSTGLPKVMIRSRC